MVKQETHSGISPIFRLVDTMGGRIFCVLVGILGIVRDIIHRKEVERLKNELVSTVSHELRTPLASLRGFAELMLEREFTLAQQREFLTIIQKESIRLTNLMSTRKHKVWGRLDATH